mmetsp:Transcript_530/g.995  ORF Transcript_530/g.995 Transcript_530/m.995 type:complete len:205 (+) Transcript_530:2840-3454(+)
MYGFMCRATTMSDGSVSSANTVSMCRVAHLNALRRYGSRTRSNAMSIASTSGALSWKAENSPSCFMMRLASWGVRVLWISFPSQSNRPSFSARTIATADGGRSSPLMMTWDNQSSHTDAFFFTKSGSSSRAFFRASSSFQRSRSRVSCFSLSSRARPSTRMSDSFIVLVLISSLSASSRPICSSSVRLCTVSLSFVRRSATATL